jgi:hypothetical protein
MKRVRVRPLRVRAVAALLLLLVAGSTSSASPCSMTTAGPEAAEHSCCAKGLTAAPPPCCHAQLSAPNAATLVWKPSYEVVLAAAAGFFPVRPPTVPEAAAFHSAATPRLHSPPRTVLRI